MLSRPKAAAPDEPSIGDDGPVWAIGDLHGCLDLTQAMLAEIGRHEGEDARPRVVFLGDYVDRGPASREVLDLLIGLRDEAQVRPTFIRGNHDFMMQAFLRGPDAGPAWLAMGAEATLRSYNVQPPLTASPSQWRSVQAAFAHSVPEAHVAFLETLQHAAVQGDYIFTHAGLRPGRALAKQKPTDLMWIRQDFLKDTRRLEKVVVHGHTVTAAPFRDHRRIGVDTGAYASGVLTAVRFEGVERRFVQVQRGARGRIKAAWDVAVD